MIGQRIPLDTVPTLRSDLLIVSILLYKSLFEGTFAPKIPLDYKGFTFILQWAKA
jgi:hypothetical protein